MDVPHPEPAPVSLSRRSLIKRGLVGGALLAAGGAGFLALRGGLPVTLPPDGLLVFSPAQFAVLDAVARRMVRPRPGWPTVDEVGVARAADRIAARVEPSAQKELKQLLGLFENGLAGFLFGGRTRPFTRLEGAEQDAVLAEWRDSRLAVRRTGHAALRTLVLAGYYQTPSIWPAVGYSGPPGIFQDGPSQPQWRGGDQPRPDDNGVWHGEPLP
ncbi:MAG TPA: gluconate 2-dehydrogenase subunit 3 family protein [Myxococcaceae bacterium]|nr:gluconate 2-dehydrogenase subunit 3 family protein [Myxococcaceae bacterium]